MYADVVVLTYQSPEIGTYTYEIPEDFGEGLKIGQLVRVPFGTRTEFGIVTEIKNQKPEGFKIRPVVQIAYSTPLLQTYQIKLLKWMANYYHAPMVNCLEAILPDIPTKVESQTTNIKIESGIRQTLVLVPTINRLPETLAKFPRAKNYVLYHNQLKTQEKFETWLKILSGTADYIFGSRSAILSPCPNLEKIIIFDEHDQVFKDERSPYFDTLSVAEKICNLTGCKLQVIDSSPKITTYFSHSSGVEITKAGKNQLKIQIVSMVDERNAGNKSPLSELLISSLRQTYQKGGRSLLFLNKKIESGQIFCNNCYRQSYSSSKPLACPLCNSQNIWFYSLNIAALANTVRQLIPKAQVRLISESIQLSNYPTIQQPTIDIATSVIFYAQIIEKYNLVCQVATDQILNIPDFASPEKAFSQITDLKRLTRDNGLLILQTFKPENQVIQKAAKNDWHSFYESQLSDRKMLSYPPFSILVKLTIKAKDIEKISREAEELILQLREKSQIPNLNIFILGPYQPVFTSKIPRYNIILKVKVNSYALGAKEKALEGIKDLLDLAGRQWQITVEPDSLN